jgi:hypothetical protein
LDMGSAAWTDFIFGAAEVHLRSQAGHRDAWAVRELAVVDREYRAATVADVTL